MAVTIQNLISHSRLLNQLIAQMNAIGVQVLSPAQVVIWNAVATEALVISQGLNSLGLQNGSGLFPNTFVRNGRYIQVFTTAEEVQAIAAGYVVATFPQTMIKFGSPDRVVHNAVEKNQAITAGYTLPGLPVPPLPTLP